MSESRRRQAKANKGHKGLDLWSIVPCCSSKCACLHGKWQVLSDEVFKQPIQNRPAWRESWPESPHAFFLAHGCTCHKQIIYWNFWTFRPFVHGFNLHAWSRPSNDKSVLFMWSCCQHMPKHEVTLLTPADPTETLTTSMNLWPKSGSRFLRRASHKLAISCLLYRISWCQCSW